jgi:hypothetical protein
LKLNALRQARCEAYEPAWGWAAPLHARRQSIKESTSLIYINGDVGPRSAVKPWGLDGNMKAKWKLALWILLPFLLCNIVYLAWIPGLLQYEAWKKDRELSATEVFRIVFFWYLMLPGYLLLIPLRLGIFYQVIFGVLTTVWVIYLVKLHAEYRRVCQYQRRVVEEPGK